jgi:hypothetical protein
VLQHSIRIITHMCVFSYLVFSSLVLCLNSKYVSLSMMYSMPRYAHIVGIMYLGMSKKNNWYSSLLPFPGNVSPFKAKKMVLTFCLRNCCAENERQVCTYSKTENAPMQTIHRACKHTNNRRRETDRKQVLPDGIFSNQKSKFG